jgi:hypothetical protein
VEGLAAIASAVSGIAAVWAAYAGLRRARREARALCDDELDQTRQRLAQARTESEQLARQLHAARMKP